MTGRIGLDLDHRGNVINTQESVLIDNYDLQGGSISGLSSPLAFFPGSFPSPSNQDSSLANQMANTPQGQLPRHEATSSDPSLDTQSEKTLIEDSKESIPSPPPSAPRRGFWRRILDRLSGSKHSSSSKGSPPLPDQSGKTHRSQTPVLRNGRWLKPKKTCTVQRGRIPPRRQYKYEITRAYSPVERVTPKSKASAPWVIWTALCCDTVAGLVDAPPQWLENLRHCWYDKIYVDDHPMVGKKNSYVRRIDLAYLSANGSGDWSAAIGIWHDDAEWLAGLSYSDIRGMLLRRSLILTAGLKHDPDDCLKNSELFYIRYPKPGVYFGIEGNGVPSEESLRAVVDIEEPMLWEQFDKHHFDFLENTLL